MAARGNEEMKTEGMGGNGIASMQPDDPIKGFTGRDQHVKQKEASGEITFETIRNDGSFQMMKSLVDLKNIFSKQLPKMPKEYICKLMFDRKHEAVVIKKEGKKIIGGICYRIYEEQKFAEIAFLAITSEEQIQGFGTRLMNRLKKEMTERKIEFLMTYADNLAIQYFKKQGFSESIQVPPEIWKGYLKDYDGSTHMECLINPTIDYSEISSQIKSQKQFIINTVTRLVSNGVVHPGLPPSFFKKGELDEDALFEKIRQIPGVAESGFTREEFEHLKNRPKATSFISSCKKIIDQLDKQKNVWPFRFPVRKEEVPDYHEIIKKPMDLTTIRQKIEKNEYHSKEDFEADVKLIFENAKSYNHPSTIYYKYAEEVEQAALKLLANLKYESAQADAADANEKENPNDSNDPPTKKIKVK